MEIGRRAKSSKPGLEKLKEAQTFELGEVQARLDQAGAELEPLSKKLQEEEAKFEAQERLHLGDELVVAQLAREEGQCARREARRGA